MERDDNESPAGGQARRQRVGKRPLQVDQLVIDCNPQRLEHSCRRMTTSSASANGVDNRLGKFFSGSDRRFPTSLHQPRSNPSAVPLFTPQPQTLFQLPFLNRSQPFPCRLPPRVVEPEVKRTIVGKPKTAVVVCKLVR